MVKEEVRRLIEIYKNNNSVIIKGHANYNPGNDIVCSAVSTLTFTLIGSLTEFNIKHETSLDVKGVSTIQIFEKNKTEKMQKDIILKIVFNGLQQIADKYPLNVKILS
jgi:uncharacterized protein YsxB (DUF464 family)